MKHIIYKFTEGMEIQVDRDFTSFVVARVESTNPDGEIDNLIVYKDWAPEKQCWDYHVSHEEVISYVTLRRATRTRGFVLLGSGFPRTRFND